MRNLEEADRPSGASDLDSRLVWGALGVIAVGAVVCASRAMAFLSREYSDEDRPPIIVRGGSLYFISGDAYHSKNEFKYGKQWVHHSQGWKPKHDKGKSVNFFVVDVYPSDHTQKTPKPPTTYKTEELTVKQGIVPFTVTIHEGPGNSKPSPAIIGPLKPGGSAANPALIYEHEGSKTIDSVSFITLENHSVSHTNPAEVRIWQC